MTLPSHPSFSVRATTGTLAATLAADSAVFAMRHSTTADTRVYIHRILTQFAPDVDFTAAGDVLFQAVRFDSATHTGGTAYGAVAHNNDSSTGLTDIRAATTAALTDTSVVYADDHISLLAAGTPKTGTVYHGFDLILERDPIVLDAGEGLAIRNMLTWPAAGSGTLAALVSWTEG